MKLTTEQETLLVVLVAVEGYKTDKDYGKDGLLDKIGDLDMEENGFYMEEMLDDFKALKSRVTKRLAILSIVLGKEGYSACWYQHHESSQASGVRATSTK